MNPTIFWTLVVLGYLLFFLGFMAILSFSRVGESNEESTRRGDRVE